MNTSSRQEQLPEKSGADFARGDLPARLDLAMRRHDLSCDEMSAMLATGPRSVRSWVTRRAPIGPPVLRIIELLDILDRVEPIEGPGGVRSWLYTEAAEFDGHCPAELIERGEGREVAVRVTESERGDLVA